MSRKILVCPIGQLSSSVQNLVAALKTYKSSDENRYTKFADTLQVNSELFIEAGSKSFLRRYRIFSNNLQNGGKLFNSGFSGTGENPFQLIFCVQFPVGEPFFAYGTQICPALNEWNDINTLFIPGRVGTVNGPYYIYGQYTVSADFTNIPSSVIAQSLPDDMQIQLEIDV